MIDKKPYNNELNFDPADLDFFASEVAHWVDALSLNDWRVAVIADCLDPEIGAKCEPDAENKQAHIFLNKTSCSESNLKEYALHEVLELLLSPFHKIVETFIPEDKHAKAFAWNHEKRHEIINRLINLLLPTRGEPKQASMAADETPAADKLPSDQPTTDETSVLGLSFVMEGEKNAE